MKNLTLLLLALKAEEEYLKQVEKNLLHIQKIDSELTQIERTFLTLIPNDKEIQIR